MQKKQKLYRRVGIVGLGLIGGSIGLDLMSLGVSVKGLVRNPQNVYRAKERGLAEVVSTDLEILRDCDVIILALPINELIHPSSDLINALPSNAVITDVASVKAPILEKWNSLHPKFVGSHPMAGTALSGIESGQLALFNDRPWVVTPELNTDLNALKVVKEIAFDLGCKLIETDPRKHDETVSLISHLPVFISAALIRTLGECKDPSILQLSKELASTGFEDTSRVGGGNPQLGASMAENNTSAVLKALSSYRWSLEQLEGAILNENWPQLFKELQKTQYIRNDLMNDNNAV